MLTLICALVGFESPPFAVDVDAGETVGDVKTMIQKKKQDTIKCNASELELHLATQDNGWLPEDDFDAEPLVDGEITPGIQRLVDGNPEEPGKPIQEWLADKRMPQPSTQQIHILVKVPVRYHPHPWRVSASIYDAMDTEISRIIYRLNYDYSGHYDPELRKDTKDMLLWYEGTALHTRSLFRRESTALLYDNDLHDESITEMSPFEGLKVETRVAQVLGEPSELRPISLFDFKAGDVNFPEGMVSSVVDQTTDEFKYQRIECEEWFGSFGMADNWCLLKKDSYLQRPCYQKYARDRSCRLALSRGMNGWYYGISCDIPVVNMIAESVSEHPVIGNRFEIKLLLRVVDSQYGKLIAMRLKSGARVSNDFLEMRTSVYVKDPLSFCACMDWKHAHTADIWEKFFKRSPAME